MWEPVKKQSLAASVFEQLRGHIVTGEMAPGEALPAERVLAERLGVNRSAVREALKRLEQAGLVAIQQGGSTKVLNYRQTGGLELLASMFVDSKGRLNTGVAKSVVEMRASLAPDVARACARRADEAVAHGLRSLVEKMKESEADLNALQRLTFRFWALLVDGTQNVAYQLAYNALEKTHALVQEELQQAMAGELQAIEQYEKLANAVANHHETQAVCAIETIVGLGSRALLSLLEEIDSADQRGEEI